MERMTLTEGSNTIDGPNGQLHVYLWPARTSEADRPILAIHGVDGSSAVWSRAAEELDGVRSVLAVDLRGRGASTLSGPFGVAAHVDDLVALLENAAIGPVTVVGHSFGGHVAARLGADRPDLVSSLVLVDGGAPRVVPDAMTPEDAVAGALSNIVPKLADKPHPVTQASVEADFASMVIDPVAARALFEVTVPVHLLQAELGVAPGLPPVIPDAVVEELTTAGLELTVDKVEGATHFSVLDAPALIAALA